jgi:hypothetical protein
MLPSIRRVLAQFKDQWSAGIASDEELGQLCRGAGMQWRQTLLNPLTTLRLFFLQILHGNLAIEKLPHLSGLSFAASAYCQARQRLPLEIFQRLLARVTKQLLLASPLASADRWHGHRVFLLDGTGCSLPDTPALQKHFGQPTSQQRGCGFPVAYGLALMHFGSGLIQGLVMGPVHGSEPPLTPHLHPALQPGDVVVGDAIYGNFVQLALLALRGVHGLFRVSATRIMDFTPDRPHVFPEGMLRRLHPGAPRSRWCRQLGPLDQIVQWFRPSGRPKWMTPEQWASLPELLTVRELRYRIARPGFRPREITLVTTLLDERRYSAQQLADLYQQRWSIEINFRHLKITLGMDQLHCQTVAGVQKEMAMFCLVYNLVRLVMGLAAQGQRVPIERISFSNALAWLIHTPRLDHDPHLTVNPIRPPRFEPRVIKRRKKQFPYLNRPRSTLRKALLHRYLRLT